MDDDWRSSVVGIDRLVPSLLRLDADALRATAVMDAESRLRLGPDEPTVLDGVEVIVRRTMADWLSVRAKRSTAVRLLTQTVARAEGWPDARVGNLSRLFVWARSVGDREHGAVRPRLLEPDATSIADEVSGHDLAKGWLALDPMGHVGRLRMDETRSGLPEREAAAQSLLAWILSEAMETFEVMRLEGVEAVRLKTEGDARLADHPGATASNVALVLAAGLYHARTGHTVVFLPPREGFSEELVEAGLAFGRRHGARSKIDGSFVADRLLLKDLCARDYVHLGRDRAWRVASRMVRQGWERNA